MTTDRDATLLSLRPAIAAELPAEADGTVGDFLHRTLRPVLKLQNDALLRAVAAFLRDHHVPFAAAPPAEQARYLTELLGRNVKLRYTIVGLITAMFTGAEAAFYDQHRAELNRRLLELAQHRALDQAAAIAERLG
ncbi:hypothetical protein [uncultured Hymenobacter sp.]|uniref:hypothetical protein n=1 Tax=uncultured Hymenobacter sp. TaxID=170016 RepID=UPI0035CA33CF